jgi:hypothetical protein
MLPSIAAHLHAIPVSPPLSPSQVTLIQSHVRRYLAQRRISRVRGAYTRAATMIQAAARSWLARRDRDRVLWDAETRERRRIMLQLLSHSRYLEVASDTIEKVGHPSVRPSCKLLLSRAVRVPVVCARPYRVMRFVSSAACQPACLPCVTPLL